MFEMFARGISRCVLVRACVYVCVCVCGYMRVRVCLGVLSTPANCLQIPLITRIMKNLFSQISKIWAIIFLNKKS